MSTDDITELLATARCLSTTAPVWQRVALGQLSPEAATASLRGQQEPASLARAAELFAPPSSGQREAMLDELLARAPLFARPVTEARVPPDIPAASQEKARSRGRPRGRLASAMVAVAAAMLLTWGLSTAWTTTHAPPFHNTFGLELRGTVAEVRGFTRVPHDGIAVYRIDGDMDARLRPQLDQAVGPVTMVAFAYDSDGDGRVLTFASEQVRSGEVFRVREGIESMGLTLGTWDLAFVLGRPGSLPRSPQAVAPGVAIPNDAPFTVTRETIHIIGEGHGPS